MLCFSHQLNWFQERYWIFNKAGISWTVWAGIKDITQQRGSQVGISLAGNITSLWQKLTEAGIERVQDEGWHCFPLWLLLFPAFLTGHNAVVRTFFHWRHSLRTGLSMLPDTPAVLEPQGFLLDFNFFHIRCECWNNNAGAMALIRMCQRAVVKKELSFELLTWQI
jgi:hypothetical protein